MRNTREIAAGVAVATAAVMGSTGCGTETPAHMTYTYEATSNVDLELADAQKYLGEMAVGILASEPISLKAFGTEYQTRLHVPDSEAARNQHITFVPDLPTTLGFGTGITNYDVKRNEKGEMEPAVESQSTITQSGGKLGVISSTVLHFCLPLGQESTPRVTNEDTYRGIQTAICTSAGQAAKYSIAGKGYAEYVADINASTSSGEIRPPVLSERQFNAFDVHKR